MEALFAKIIVALFTVGPQVWSDIKNGKTEDAKRKIREKVDREIEIAVAKEKLRLRKAAKKG